MDLQNIAVLLQLIMVGLIGSVGNVLVLIVYMKKLRENEISTLFIVLLAVTDLICCVFLIPITCYVEIVEYIDSDLLCKFHVFFNIANITFSCLLMTLIAFERYFSIIWPLYKIITKIRAKLIVLILLIICFCIALLGALGMGIDHKVHHFVPANGSYSFNETMDDVNLNQIADILKETPVISNNISIYQTLGNMSGQLTVILTRTNQCFPNDLIITHKAFIYIKLVQNLIPVVCFFAIFFLYAAIYLSVVKRRQMKKIRANYYNEIVKRSRQHNNNFISVAQAPATIGLLSMNSVQSELTPPKKSTSNHLDANLNNMPRNVSEMSMVEFSRTHSTAHLNGCVNPEKMKIANLNGNGNGKKINEACKLEIKNRVESNKNAQKQKENGNLLSPGKNKRMSLDVSCTTETTRVSDYSRKSRTFSNFNMQECDKNQSVPDVNIFNSSTIMANIKTAFMLFVVTLIFAVVYTPALLTSFLIIPYHPFYWNLYFINNAANPLVYSFLNKNFRHSLKLLYESHVKCKSIDP